MDEALLEITRSEIQRAKQILVVSHIRPDGDAVGSMLGLGLALQENGKSVQMVLEDGVPSSECHLTGSELVQTTPDGEFDLTIVVDCSDLARVGDVLKAYGTPDWNIDHHFTNLNFARINIIQPEAASTAEMIAQVLPLWHLTITNQVANALLTGVLTDTLGFRTSNVTPTTLRIAAELVEAGANLYEVYQHSLLQRSYQAVRYWGEGLSKIQREGRMVWTTLTREDRHIASYPGRDDADLTNIVSAITDIDISVVFVEQNNSHVKVSWRSSPGYDVSQIALIFGGGGHKAAAGAEVQGTLDEVVEKVITATRSLTRAA